MSDLDLKSMLKAGIHFGHKTSRWSPRMSPYLWGARNGVHLFDVSKTAYMLDRAGSFIKEIAQHKGSVLWVGTKKPAQTIIKNAATQTESPFVIHRWIGGTLTNYEQVKKAMSRLLHLRDVVEKSLDIYGKKEQSMLQKELFRLEKNIGGILDLDYPPKALIVVDPKKEHAAVKEAYNKKIPVVAIVDSNTNPDAISFVIPANDDSPRSISYIIDYLVGTYLEGQELASEEELSSSPETEEPVTEAPEVSYEDDQDEVDGESDKKEDKKRKITRKKPTKQSKNNTREKDEDESDDDEND